MSKSADLYVNGIRKRLNNYFAAWMPNTQHELGDVGVFDGNFFIKVTSLQELNIPFAKREDKDSTTPINFVSTSDVKKTSKSSADINSSILDLPSGKAGIQIEFGKEGAYIFEAETSYESSITNLIQVEENIREVFKNGDWKATWCIVSRIVHTPTASIFISDSSQSMLVMSVESNVPVARIKLGDGSANLSEVSSTGSMFKAPNATNLTPFFQVHQLEAKPLEQIQVFFSGMKELQSMISSQIKSMDVITPSLAKANAEISKALFLNKVDSTGKSGKKKKEPPST
jgi:hypothetical protein